MEDKKKLYYKIGAVVLLILGYLNYYGDEKEDTLKEKIIETVGVKYTSEDYIIDAGKQLDYIDKGESSFELAKAKVKDMLLSGDNAFLDKARNLALSSNILGISPNGWSFKAENIKYDKLKDEITSVTGVFVENKEKKLSVSGKEFKTDSKMSYIDLKKDVTLENEKIKVIGDIGHYVDDMKVAVLYDNVHLIGKEVTEKDGKKLSGEFKKLNYDLNTKILETFDPYTVSYGDAQLFAENLSYNQAEESMLVTKNVSMKVNGFDIKLDKIEKKSMSDVLDFYGPINGADETYKIYSDNGNYDTKSKNLTMLGNVSVISKEGDVGTADKVVYNSETEIMDAYAINKDVVYKTKDGMIESKKVNFDNKTRELKIDTPFKFSDKDKNGTAKELYYNDVTKEGNAKDVVIYTKDKVITTSKVLYNGVQNVMLFPEEYKITSKDKTSEFTSTEGVYNLTTKDFTTEKSFVYVDKGNTTTGVGIVYNTETGVGEIKKDIHLVNEEKKIDLVGDRAEIKNGEFADLIGNVAIRSGVYSTKVSKASYSFKDEKIRILEQTNIKSDDGISNLDILNPIIDTKNECIYGDNFKANNEKYRAQSDKVEYFYGKELIHLIKNAVVEENGMVIKGDNLFYNSKEERAESKGPYIANNAEWTLNGVDIVMNNITGDVKGGKVSALSTKKESFESDKVNGNLNKTVDFIGNAKGKTYDKDGVPIEYAGDIVKTHYIKEGDSYKLKRIELVDNSTIKKQDMTLYSKYSDMDLITNIATSLHRPKAVKVDPVKGDKTMEANKMEFHTKKDTIYLYEDVVVVSNDPKKGSTIGKGEKGKILTKENVAELEDNAVIDSPEAILYADKVIYNMDTKKARATGDKVRVDYKKK
ncbi:MAG: LPS export ABC transporter periplasmic protein LptC [Fusobacteriaceae bacterium]|nr:LPS export ABC transporter periplasmic protein LptC [Fusobacteriaceae bacterium]